MLKKFSTKTLFVLLVVLLGAVVTVKLLDSKKGERNFRSVLVEIDTSTVSSILMYPKSNPGQEVKLYLDKGNWKVRVNEELSMDIDESRLQEIFKQSLALLPKRLASRTENRWKEYEVDSAATRVVMMAGDQQVLELYIGRFTFQQGQNTIETFVRVGGEADVYVVEGFLDPLFNQDINAWRDKTIVKGDPNNWTTINVTTGEDHYMIELVDSTWQISGVVVDIDKISEYTRVLSNLSGTTIVDDISNDQLTTPVHILEIENKLGDKMRIEGFLVGERKIIRSSVNLQNLFDGLSGELSDKLFLPIDQLTASVD